MLERVLRPPARAQDRHFHQVTNGMTRCACLRNLIGTLFLASGCGAAEPSLIPWPAKVATGGGDFVISGQMPVCAAGVADSVVRQFQATVKAVAGEVFMEASDTLNSFRFRRY